MSVRAVALGALLAVLGTGARAHELKLTVDWGGVRLSQFFPVTGGIPFARGRLPDPRAVRLLCGGRACPLQTEVLARWPDGSVKWLLLDFQLPPAESALTLEYGEGVRPQEAAGGVRAQEGPDGVRVDTGAISFTVRSDGAGFIDELTYGGTTLFARPQKRMHLLDFIHTAKPADYHPRGRYVTDGEPDPSRLKLAKVYLEKTGPLHAIVVLDGVYTYEHVGSTITGTTVKGDCPFRVRLHAYAGQSFITAEHFFVYEGDGDHDFVTICALKVPALSKAEAIPDSIRFIGEETITVPGPQAGLYQQSSNDFLVWNAAGQGPSTRNRGRRFEGVLDVRSRTMGIAVGVRAFWQNAPKSLHADLRAGELGVYLWPPEATALDFRRHAREWSVGETGTPDDPSGRKPAPFTQPNYRLASKGVGKTHYALVYVHPADTSENDIRSVYTLFDHRPLLWAPPRHYAETLALGRYREFVPGDDEAVEAALASGIDVWKLCRERNGWYGFWLYGNVCQDYNGFIPNGRWCREFGRWGWANGDSVGRLAYALMLQAVRRTTREDFEFGESYLYHVHDVCSTHTPAYPHHNGTTFRFIKGAAHRHGAWPWACPYVGIRGAHPVGAKIYHFLTGEGRVRDILEELTELALRTPNGGEGDGPLGPNAQLFLYQWEATGKAEWRDRLERELAQSELLRTADSGWLCMMSAAFGIKDALEEYQDLSGDAAMRDLAASFADRCMPETMKRHWTWGGYFRVYAAAYNATGDGKYRRAIEEMLEKLVGEYGNSLAAKIPKDEWPGPAGGPTPFVDANIVRDVPFALYSLHTAPVGGGK